MTDWQPIETAPVGRRRGQKIYDLRDRILRLSMPEPNSGCWLWLSAVRENGNGQAYGSLIIGSRTDGTRQTVRAHRLSYEVFKGEIPEGLYVCHTCDVGICVNPDHLWLGTPSDNTKDGVRKGRIKPPIRWPKTGAAQ